MSATRTNGEAATKILVIDDHPLAREALARLIGALGSGTEMLEADSLAAAHKHLAAHADLALVILDIALPDAGGPDAIARVQQAWPETPVLVLLPQDEPAMARAMLAAGARGVISQRSPTRVLVEAIRLVLVGGTYVPPEALRAVAAPRPAPVGTPQQRASGHVPSLTQRQLDVLALLAQGQPNKLICRMLNLAEGTVKTHIAAIYRALNVMNRTQAVYAATRLGLALVPPADPDAGREAAATQGRAVSSPARRAVLSSPWQGYARA